MLVIIGWWVGWLVGNAVFSETALRIFLIFCMKLGDYDGKKVTIKFLKKNFIWRYSEKRLQISPKWDTLIFFSKLALTTFLVFELKLVLKCEWTLFFRTICNLGIFDFEIVKNSQNWGFWPFCRLCIISFSYFYT